MQPSNTVFIDWHYAGDPDPLYGTGATRAEKSLVWIAGLVAALATLYTYTTGAFDWTWWEFGIAAAIAFDIAGGMVANSLNSGKRFYHTPARDDDPRYVRLLKNPYLFSALHVYPLIVGGLHGDGNWLYGGVWYGLLLAATLAVLQVPLYLRRPLSMLIVFLVLVGNTWVIEPAAGFAWLAPALFLKIVYGHLVREEPYRPAAEREKSA
ncbi:MAG: hypothetical protein JXB35_00195 [Anaerolineae bacterium]|nr:hypothetical protein [Anaerolineae bacterium]